MPSLSSESIDYYFNRLKISFPKLKIHKNKPWWLRFIFNLPGVKKLKWGEATQTIGMNIWLSDRWDEINPIYQLATLRHEKKHLIWFRNHTTVLASLLYLFFIFPIGLAYYRAIFERDGCRESIRTIVQFYGAGEKIKDKCLQKYLHTFTGWGYFKMWPFPETISRWFLEDWIEITTLYE